MSDDELSGQPTARPARPDEAEVARVLEAYLADLEAGRPADPDRLIAAHPELAGPLRACLKVMHLAAGRAMPAERRGCRPIAGDRASPSRWPQRLDRALGRR